MAKATQKGLVTGLDFIPMLNGDMTQNAERMLFGAAHIQGMIFRSMLKYNLEAARFLQHRLESDLKTSETLAKCKSFSELNEAGVEFCQRAMEEYTDEAAKLTNLGAGLMSETAEDVQKEAAQVTVQ
jgi:DNA repair photolyase